MKIQTDHGEVHVLTACPLLDSTESFEFLTEIERADDGTEYRNILRPLPRQYLSFSYIAMQQALGDLFHMLSANMRKLWGIPLVHLKKAMSDVVFDDFIAMDTSKNSSDYHLGHVLIRQSNVEDRVEQIIGVGRYIVTQQSIIDPVTQEVIEPEQVEYQDGYRLANAITTSNAFMMPLRICILLGDVDSSAWHNGMQTKLEFAVLAEDGPDFCEIVPTQYKNEDFYTAPLLLSGSSLEMNLSQHQTVVDGAIGGFTQYTDHDKPRYSKPMRCVMKSQNELIDFRKFLMRRFGRFRPFWLPLYERHLNIVSTGMLSNWLDVGTNYVIEADRKHLAVKINDVWQAHEITNKVINSGITRLTVSPALNVQRNQIQSVCYLALHRLDADRIEFAFLGVGISTTTILMQEIST
jgi:hypothetical protein